MNVGGDDDDCDVTTLVSAMTGPQSFKRPEAAYAVVKHQPRNWSPPKQEQTRVHDITSTFTLADGQYIWCKSLFS